MKRLYILFIAILATATLASAQRTTRSRLVDKPGAAVAEQPMEPLDTISAVTSAQVAINGYDKTLRSRRESFFVTNNTGSKLVSIQAKIVYTDLTGRTLHSRTEWIPLYLPAGETRNFTIATWDRQSSFYYRRSQRPKRTVATPYDIKFTILRAVFDQGL